MNEMKVRITFREPLLGTCSGNHNLHREYIASRSKDAAKLEEEMADLSAEEMLEKALTIFPRNDGRIFIWDYQVKGFIKEAIGVQVELGNAPKILTKWSYKRAVDSCIFVNPRRIFLIDEHGVAITEPHGVNQRPIRVVTMQGERVALASSEHVNAGTTCEFTITWLPSKNKKSAFWAIDEELIENALHYGALKGLGQWRNAGNGSFTHEILDMKIRINRPVEEDKKKNAPKNQLANV